MSPSSKVSDQISLVSIVFSSLCCFHSYINLFFRLYLKDKFSESKVKFRQASNHYKRVLEPAKLAYDNKTRVLHFPETWLSGLLVDWQVFSTKVNLLYLLYSTARGVVFCI